MVSDPQGRGHHVETACSEVKPIQSKVELTEKQTEKITPLRLSAPAVLSKPYPWTFQSREATNSFLESASLSSFRKSPESPL